jgi:phosphoribosylanthranilate isomerase
MNKTLIKICGVRDPHIATFAAKAGADFIGIIFHPTSKRYVELEQAIEIAAAAKQAGAKPVAIFVDTNAEMILKICQATQINIVQLHGQISRQQHHLLPPNIKRIYVRTVAADGQIQNDKEGGEIYLDHNRDYLLFDNIQEGSGKTFNWSNFSYTGNLPWFFSGGLTADNVKMAIQLFDPSVVDVSSGVEKAPGEKDENLIYQFINAVK